jgi:hypothetical protein
VSLPAHNSISKARPTDLSTRVGGKRITFARNKKQRRARTKSDNQADIEVSKEIPRVAKARHAAHGSDSSSVTITEGDEEEKGSVPTFAAR